MPFSAFTFYGPAYAPFKLSVSLVSGPKGIKAASSGAMTTSGDGGAITFDQSLNSLPFIIAGEFEPPIAVEHNGVKIEVFSQPGVSRKSSDTDSQATRLLSESTRIVDFLTKTLGPAPAGMNFRIISSFKTGNISQPGALVLNQNIFRQDILDVTTTELLVDAISRAWFDGSVRIRGQEARTARDNRPGQRARGTVLLRDSLPRYIASLYFEERFGTKAVSEVYERMRWSYVPVAKTKRDPELAMQTHSSPSYGAAAFGKGPLVLRLFAEALGREKFISAIKSLTVGPQTRVILPEDFQKALIKEGGPVAEKLYQQWFDTVIEPDFVIGLPQPSATPGIHRVALRNLGTGDMPVTVSALTASGKRLMSQVSMPSEDITYLELRSDEKIIRVEVDPEKMVPQTNYDNDINPHEASSQTLLNDAQQSFNKSEFAVAVEKLKLAVKESPQNSALHAWLARALIGDNKPDEAMAEANIALKIEPALPSALSWSHYVMGQVAALRGKPSEAVEHYKLAVIWAMDAPAQYASREALVKAEKTAATSGVIDESIRGFITKLDINVKNRASDQLNTMIARANLRKFIQGLIGSPISSWTTDVLRGQYLDSNRVAVDVFIKTQSEARDRSGTAVYILNKSQGSWILEDVQLFNVK
jgi:hypothetical protein